MDINDLRSVITLVSFGLFVAIAAWAWWPRNQRAFDDAARLPFANDNDSGASTR